MDDPTTATDTDTADVSTSSPAEADANTTTTTTSFSAADAPSSADSDSAFQAAVDSLSSLIPDLPLSSLSSATDLLDDSDVASHISSLLRRPESGSGDDNLCRWLYDTFQTGNPSLQLIVLRYVPVIAGAYLSRAAHRKPLAGFEAVLLALYSHMTASRSGQSVTVTIPDVSHPSIYHETRDNVKNNIATDLNIAVVSPSLEPHGTVRSTRRSRIVGVALELYYSRISEMPVRSKIDFCDFCVAWAGHSADPPKKLIEDAQTETKADNETNTKTEIETETETETETNTKTETETETKTETDPDRDTKERGGGGEGGRVGGVRMAMPWELLQPALRVLGHCLCAPESAGKEKKNAELVEAASRACRSLYGRSLHDIDSKAILATGSLLRLTTLLRDRPEVDFTEIPNTNIIIL